MKRILLALSLVAIVLIAASSLTGQPAVQVPGSGAADEQIVPGRYLGVTSCAASGCHGSPEPVENANILMNEYDSWLHAPAPTHARAYEVLLNPVSQRIARNLRLPQPPQRTPLCLDCHALHVPQQLQEGSIELADGVQCESCHGPASGWRADHFRDGWTREDSIRAGMIDTKSPEVRATLCLGCHLGDERRRVDHDLIAAGHPILTFELDNFTESRFLPVHWRPADEVERQGHGVRAWAVGQAVAFRQSLDLLVRDAGSERWPEFTHHDCSSCHHQLRDGAWRQERGYRHRPGMPLWSPARWVVLRHIVSSVAPAEREPLDREIGELAGAVGRMANEQEIIRRARAVRSRLAPLVARIDAAEWNEVRSRQLFSAIASAHGDVLTRDRQSAEQSTWALVSLTSHLVRSDRGTLRAPTTREVDRLFREVQSSEYPDELDRESYARTLAEIHRALSRR
jgi:hypothetical protein